eukprot:gene14416-11151_t
MRDLTPFVVRVGKGTGVLIRAHRDVPRTPLRRGDLLIATCSHLVFPNRGIGGLVSTLPAPDVPGRIAAGTGVAVTESFMSDSRTPVELRRGAEGTVVRLDDDGDAL